VIDKKDIEEFVEKTLAGTDLFPVGVTVTPDNVIDVTIESARGVTIDDCVELTHKFEAEFDRDKDDYELTVGSAGLTAPFTVRRQYEIHLGDPVEVLAADGKKYRGTLESAGEDSFTVTVAEKVRKEGEKRPKMEDVTYTFPYSEVKYTKYLL
jgi:ribosome maturation factor RimP